MLKAATTKKSITQVSWGQSDVQLSKRLSEAKNGMAIIQDLNLDFPLQSIRSLFDQIYSDPVLATRLNAAYPKRGLFKTQGMAMESDVDRKVPFDLSPLRLQAILRNDPSLVDALGQNFLEVVAFYSKVQDDVIRRLLHVSSMAINGGVHGQQSDLQEIHRDMNYNYRLLDYFEMTSGGRSARCGEHRDYGTFSLIFQDNVGGLEIEEDGCWLAVPPTSIVFLWGWCATILSNGRIQAPLHRVVAPSTRKTLLIETPRRNSAIFFVAPDLGARLKPVRAFPSEKWAFNQEVTDNLTVGEFKNWMGIRWRKREGTVLEEEEEDMQKSMKGRITGVSQDTEIKAFLNGQFLH